MCILFFKSCLSFFIFFFLKKNFLSFVWNNFCHGAASNFEFPFLVYLLINLLVYQFLGGSIAKGSELQIEVGEFLWRNVQVASS